MKGRLLIAAIILLVISFLINIVHVVWVYVNPQGFWSFQHFVDLLRTLAFIIILAVATTVFVIHLASNIYTYIVSFFNKDVERPNLLKVTVYGVAYLVIMVINFFWVMGFSLSFNKRMADRYSYIKQSDILIDEGKYQEALDYAKGAYEKAKVSKRGANNFFILTNLYLQTDWAIKEAQINEFAAILNYAYCLRQDLQMLDLSEELSKKALDMTNSGVLKGDVYYKIQPTLSLAQIYLIQGKYQEAEYYFNVLLALNDKFEKDDIIHSITAYSNFAIYAHKIGDLEKAAHLKIEMLEMWEKGDLSKKSSIYLTLLIGAASGELELDHMDKAGRLIVKAKDLASDRKNKKIYLDYLALKGMYCLIAANREEGLEEVFDPNFFLKIVYRFFPHASLRDRFAEESESCFKHLVDETEDRFGNRSLAYAESLTWLAVAYSQHSKFKEAQVLYKDVLNILKETKENNLEYYNGVLLYSITSDFYAKDYKNLSGGIQQIEDFYFKKLSENYIFQTEEEREVYISNAEASIRMINSIYAKINSADFKRRLYNNNLATKNIALFSNQHIRSFIADDQDSLNLEYRNIILEKEKLDLQKQYLSFDLILEKENRLKLKEKSVLTKIHAKSSFAAFNPKEIQWKDIKASLRDNETAIEIINVPANPYTKDSIEYYALVTKNTFLEPKLVPLFLEKDIQKVLNKAGSTEQRINNIYYEDKDALYNKIWKPLEMYVQNSSKVYLSVSGALHKVSFPAILVDTEYDIIYLSSTRQIVNHNDAIVEKKSVALFGDVDYNNLKGATTGSRTSLAADFITKSFRENKINSLEYTAEEISSIHRIIKSNSKSDAGLFKGALASEEEFRKLSKSSYNIIHIATHGFYYPNTSSLSTSSISLPNMPKYGESVLNRSGIVLAGANNSNISQHNDGILTAQEISKLDLSNVDLVVLSACETGLGDLKGSEGVYGLQRAFKLAGVKSTLVSLWKVPDKQTSELMNYFYQHYIGGASKSQSLKLAQLKMREQYNTPFFWAGFILISE